MSTTRSKSTFSILVAYTLHARNSKNAYHLIVRFDKVDKFGRVFRKSIELYLP